MKEVPRTLLVKARARTLAVLVLLAVMLFAAACGRNANSTLKRAAELADSGDYDSAAELYERYLKLDPNGGQAVTTQLKLADIYYLNLHRYDQALAHYKEFLARAPSDPAAPAARERLAAVLADLGRSFEAIAEYENISPKDESDRRRLRLRIADLYFEEKNYSQALTEYAKVTDGMPYDELGERAYIRSASIYHLERSQYLQAIPIYQKLVAETKDPKVRRRCLYAISDCRAAMYQFDQAIAALREIKDASEQGYITRRIAELEQQGREQSHEQEMAKPMKH
ncbi:MAG TPA: tetratricopeptide repeat protein [Blastocatellia bacterium]|nr:tetratricopeptide repeat protein [Blastocatellia bacterium]